MRSSHRQILSSTDECIASRGAADVIRATTLKAANGGPGALIGYYAGLARDQLDRDGVARGPVDYYLDRDEPPGRWWGTGRIALGLHGEVRPEQLEALLVARHPATGRRLGRGFGDASARGFDATFSAPKSVSLLWALTDDPWVRAEVLAAHDPAVLGALDWFEQHGAVTRRGRDGVDQVDTQGLVAALFRQHTSRSLDPQLHTHAVISTKVQDPTGKWLSLDARFLKQQQRSISWVYAAALRSELTERLGVSWSPVVDGHADIEGVPAELLDVFSKRSAQVEAKFAELIGRWVDEHDGSEPDPRTIAGLERKAALASRPCKEAIVDADALRNEWRREAQASGFERVSLPAGQRELFAATSIDRDAVVAEAIERVATSSSAWLRTDLAREVAALVPTDAVSSSVELTRLVDELADDAIARCVELHPPASVTEPRRRDGRPISEHVTNRRFTTAGVLDQEARLLAWAADAIGSVDDGGEAQSSAVAAIAGADRLVLVVGPAGTGKTTAVGRAAREVQAHGKAVVGLAPSGKAADVLGREAGTPATTVAKFLHEHTRPAGPSDAWRLGPGATVVLDESGMIATDDLAALVTLADEGQWRLVCVGDPDQLPSVGRGGVFADWCENLPTHRLDEVRRFTDAWQGEVSLALRWGDRAAATAYAARERLHVVHPALLADRVARQFEAGTQQGQNVAVTTASASTARAINVEIQRRRNPLSKGASVGLADGTCVFVGDQIATRRNDQSLVTTKGATVRNRHTWTVTALEPDGSLTVANAERGDVRLPAAYVRRHVELGWVVTGYGSQGSTVDHGICVVESSSTRAGIYVGMTRGRGHNVAWIVDRTGLLEAEEAFAAAIAKPANARTAHAVRAELHRRAGLPPPEPVAAPRTPIRATSPPTRKARGLSR